MKTKIYFLLIIVSLLFSCKIIGKNQGHDLTKEPINHIFFEKSAYGLIFTTIEVDGVKVKAMIDFGDPHMLQLSSSFVREYGIEVTKTNAIAQDIFGNTFEINEGSVNEVVIGNWKSRNVTFSSSPNEMESVSKQINTVFNAVIGWGYFSQYYTQVVYQENKFELSKNDPLSEDILFSTSYNKNASYLIVPVTINAISENLIIDTGSPVTLIDSAYYYNNDLKDLTFKIENKNISLTPYIQNLELLKQINAIGIIGGDFLAKYEIIIDPFENKVAFKAYK